MSTNNNAGPLAKGILAALVGAIVMVAVLVMFGSDDDPKVTDCLPHTATTGDAVAGPGGKVFPLKKGTYQPSSPFGPRGGSFHQGQDFAAPLGTPVYAAMGGTVADAGPARGFGHWVVIDFDAGNGQKNSNVYGHMPGASLAVKTGQQVRAGQQIAVVGSEGASSGPHLHFEVWTGGTRLRGGHAVDPMPWLAGAGEPGGAPTDPAADPAAPRGPPAAQNAAVVSPAPAPTDPSVVSAADWTKVAQLESGGNWAIDTGNGYQGGLQFSPSTWTGNGGTEFAPSANKATPAQQMEVANRVLKSQGWGAWPVTSKGAGVTGKKPAPAGTFLRGAPAPAAQAAAAVAPAPGAGCLPLGVGTALRPGSVPPAFEPWIIKAGRTCPEVTAPIIAAQLENESGFNVEAHNAKSGADGPSQFVPETWAAKAVDGDGDGTKNPRSIADAVMSQAAYDCELAKIAKDDIAKGTLHGDPTELWLSMYNCGPGATEAAGGVCGNVETRNYVRNIPEAARAKFTAVGAVGPGIPNLPGAGGRAVAAAMRWRGTPYAWGGGTPSGPSRGVHDGDVADSFGDFNKIGFDCSGLTLYAIAQATDGRIVLDHYTTRQLNDPRGKPVLPTALAPGDLLFPAGSNPQHVTLYIGNGQMVEAPQSGDVVKVSPVSNLGPGFSARRFL